MCLTRSENYTLQWASCDNTYKANVHYEVLQATFTARNILHTRCTRLHPVPRASFARQDFMFYPKPLYISRHQSFFYSFITILPSESGVTLHYSYCTILPQTLSFCHSVTFIFEHLSRDFEKTTITAMGDDLHINKQTNIVIANHRRLLRQND